MNDTCPVCNGPISYEDTVCSNCGFKLQGSTQSFQPISLSGEEVIPPASKAANSVVLRVVRGPQIGTSFSLDGDRFTIGRSPQSEIFLNDMTVSRVHAYITRGNEGYRIEDANSFNGVWINNKNIDLAVLNEGDIIQIGAFCLLYQESPSS